PIREGDSVIRAGKELDFAQRGKGSARGADLEPQEVRPLRTLQPMQSKSASFADGARGTEIVPFPSVHAPLPNEVTRGITQDKGMIAGDLQDRPNFLRRVESDLPPPIARVGSALPDVPGLRRKTIVINGPRGRRTIVCCGRGDSSSVEG